MKRENGIKTAFTAEGNITVAIPGFDTVTFHPELAHPDCRRQAELFGWKQVRLVDKLAVERAAPDGHIRTDEEMNGLKHAALVKAVEHYESGTDQWTMGRVAAAPKVDYDLDHLKALATVRGGSREEVLVWARGRAEAKGIPVKVYLAGMLQVPDVRAAYDNILAGYKLNLDVEGMEEELMA